MSIAGFLAESGISIYAFGSILVNSVGSTDNLAPKIESYSHEKSMSMGDDTATISITVNQSDAETWYQTGIGRDVQVYNSAGGIVWRGFVDKVDVNLGGFSVSRGPLTDVGNKVALKYQTVRYDTIPPIGGQERLLPFISDSESQDVYGIFEKTFSSSNLSFDEAVALQKTMLRDNKEPAVSRSTTTSGTSLSVTISCKGYMHLLDTWFYADATSGSTDASNKLRLVFEADVNGLYSNSEFIIDTNTLQVNRYEDGQRTALTVVNEIASLGDADGNVWYCTVARNLLVEYRQVPNQPEYALRVAENDRRIQSVIGTLIEPWDVKPAKWLLVSDFLAGRMSEPDDLRSDPRAMLIDKVSYNAPFELQLDGAKTSSIEQKLAQFGLRGR